MTFLCFTMEGEHDLQVEMQVNVSVKKVFVLELQMFDRTWKVAFKETLSRRTVIRFKISF